MKKLSMIAAMVGSLASAVACAGPSTDALSGCLADNTSGKDRKDLARWIFVAMSAHPDMQDLSKVTLNSRDQSNQTAGQLVTRLLADECKNETRAAMQNDGGTALRTAFESLGRLAMQELMSNRNVSASMAQFERYLDRDKLQSALGGVK